MKSGKWLVFRVRVVKCIKLVIWGKCFVIIKNDKYEGYEVMGEKVLIMLSEKRII